MSRLPNMKVPGAERMQQILSAAACNKKSSDKACSLPLSIGVFFDVVGKMLTLTL